MALMPEPEQRFLIVRLSSIGDIVHTLPAVAALGEALPGAQIHWAIETRLAVLIERNPFVRRVVKLDTLGWRERGKFSETIEEAVRSILALREVPFHAAIDFQGLYKSGLIAWMSRSRERVGFAANWLREPAVGIFYTEQVAPRGRRHIIEMNLALVERLGARPAAPQCWKFPLPSTEPDDRYVDEQLAARGARQFLILNPGGGWKSKRWAPENYAGLIRRLEPELSWKTVLTGSPQEEGLIQSILERAQARQASYIPSTLVQLIALARRAKLFVSGDTGPLHLAAAVGTPIVAIYDATDKLNTPERNGPFRSEDIVLLGQGTVNHISRGKNAGYLQGVSVDSVLAAIRKRLTRAYG